MSLKTEFSGILPNASLAGERTHPRRLNESTGRSHKFVAKVFHRRSGLAEAWSRCEANGHVTAYQTGSWIDGIISRLDRGPSNASFFVEVRNAESGDVVMILPLSRSRRFGVRVISWLSHGVCDYATPLLGPGSNLSPNDMAAVWASTRAALPPTDLIDLGPIDPGIGQTPNPLTLLPNRHQSELEAYGFRVGGDASAFLLTALGNKRHKRAVKCRNKLNTAGTVRFHVAQGEAETAAIFDVMLSQRLDRFRKLGRADILAKPHVAAFYRDAALRGARGEGPARVFGISVNDEWITTALVLVHGGCLHGIILAVGGDQWLKFSPGLLMIYDLMEWCAAEGLGYCDLTVGNLPYKSELGAQPRTLFRLLEPVTAAGWLAVLWIRYLYRAKQWLLKRPRLAAFLRFGQQYVRRTISTLKKRSVP